MKVSTPIPKLLLSFLVSLSALTASYAQKADVNHTPWLHEADEYLEKLTQEGMFSGSVLVARDGHTLLARGCGLANREHEIPNLPETKFRLGSLTKQFTAMVLLILDKQGRLDLDDLISKYLMDCPKDWEQITLNHLLTHTSGIPSFTSFEDNLRYERLPTTVRATVDRFIDKPLDFKPGSKFRYSNSGYVLLGYLIEQVTGKSYEDVVEEFIFQPLGMEDSGYDHPRTILKNRASGYSRQENVIWNAVHFEMDTPHAAGALYSTVYDLLKWDQALYGSEIVSSESIRKMQTPYLGNYGFGVFIKDDRISHGGGISGFHTHLLRLPKQRMCIVVLSNFEFSDPGKVANHLADSCLSGITEQDASGDPDKPGS